MGNEPSKHTITISSDLTRVMIVRNLLREGIRYDVLLDYQDQGTIRTEFIVERFDPFELVNEIPLLKAFMSDLETAGFVKRSVQVPGSVETMPRDALVFERVGGN